MPLRTFACAHTLGKVRLGSFASGVSFGSFSWELSLGIFRLGSSDLFFFVWQASLESFSLGIFAWLLSLGASRMASKVGGSGLLMLGESAGGSWGNLQRGHPHQASKITSRHTLGTPSSKQTNMGSIRTALRLPIGAEVFCNIR